MSIKQQQPEQILMKIITLGAPGAGKTSLLLRLTNDRFNRNYVTTIGCDFFTKQIFVNNEPVRLQLWDTAGQERFQAISMTYYKGARGIFFTFDITSEESFQEVQKIYERTMEEIKNMNQNTSCILIGCKTDLEEKRKVSYDVAKSYADSLGMRYIETSAKASINCLEAADHLAKICYEQIKNQKNEEKLMLVEPHLYKKTTCC